MNQLVSYLILLYNLIEQSLSQDSAMASFNNTNPMIGDTLMMSCKLVRQNRFITESVNYIVNNQFDVFSSSINSNTGSVGGIPVSRMRATTPVSNDRITLEGKIILSNIEETDAINGVIKLGCVGEFGSDSGDNVNVTASVMLSSGSSSISIPSTIGISCYLLSLIAPLLLFELIQ